MIYRHIIQNILMLINNIKLLASGDTLYSIHAITCGFLINNLLVIVYNVRNKMNLYKSICIIF